MIEDVEVNQRARNIHHLRSNAIIRDYMQDRLQIIPEYLPRLATCIGFIAEAHGVNRDELASNEHYKRSEKIANQNLRRSILCVLLRIGDLLDLDSERACGAVRKAMPMLFEDNKARTHHEHHKHVIHFNYSSQSISIVVESHTRDEHELWTNWLNFLKQDILHANTFVFTERLKSFHLPRPEFEIRKAS